MKVKRNRLEESAQTSGLGFTIQKIREVNGISQDELAKRSGIHRTILRSLEHGNLCDVTLRTLIDISSALGVKAEILLKEATLPQESRALSCSTRSQSPLTPLTSLKDSSLFSSLEKGNKCLSDSLNLTWSSAVPILERITATHPNFTSHGPSHALGLIGILDQALKPTKLVLTTDESYILLSACILHDIGMIGPCDIGGKEREDIRKDHHLLSRDYINGNWQKLALQLEYYSSIADVVAAHRKMDITNALQSRPIGIANGESPRIQLCAALLRLADECHITYDRVPENIHLVGVSSDSKLHFIAHKLTKARYFNSKRGEIVFSVESIDSQEIDTFIDCERSKIANELNALQPIFQLYGLPYKTVTFLKRREKLVEKKVLNAILQNRRCSFDDILTTSGETVDELTHYLQNHLKSSLIAVNKDSSSGTTIYELIENVSNLKILAADYLRSSPCSNNKLEFQRSKFVQAILTDEFLNSLFSRVASVSDETAVLYRMVRKSPRALCYALFSIDSLPEKGPSIGTGIQKLLAGEVINDFNEYPELLLEPRLFDDAIGEDDKQWEQLKVKQIAEYHKVFDPHRILEQYVIPCEYEILLSPRKQKREKKFSVSFKSASTSSIESPLLLWAAASRIGLKVHLERTPSVNIMISSNDIPLFNSGKADWLSIELGPSNSLSYNHASKTVPMFCPLKLKRSNGTIKLEMQNRFSTSDAEPIILSVTPKSNAGKKQNSVKVKFSVSLNPFALDCEQAELYLDGMNQREIDVEFMSPSGEIFPMGHISSGLPPFGPFTNMSDTKKRTIAQLGNIQQLMGESIPYPILSLSREIEALLPDDTITSTIDASAIMSKIKTCIDKQKAIYVTPIMIQIINSNGDLVLSKYLDNWPGIRVPRFQIHDKNVPYECDEAFSKLESEIALSFSIKYSPFAAIKYIEKNSNSNPYCLTEARGEPEEMRSKVVMKYLPVQNRIWYKSTPLIVCIQPYENYERFYIESHYLREKGKLNHAYIAAKEAYRLAPNKEGVSINLGWYAFQCDLIDEAIIVTEAAYTNCKQEERYTCSINLGLFYLCLKKDKQAELWYKRAIGFLKMQDAFTRNKCAQEAITDLEAYLTKTGNPGEKYLKLFRTYFKPKVVRTISASKALRYNR